MANDAWLLNGNKEIDPEKNFLGTADLEPLILKVNNEEIIRISTSPLESKIDIFKEELKLPSPALGPPPLRSSGSLNIYGFLLTNNLYILDTASPFTFAARTLNLVDHLSIMSEGNIGINTENPTAKLDVDGDVLVSGRFTVDNKEESNFFGEMRLNDNVIWLRGQNDANHGLRWCGLVGRGGEPTFANTDIDGPALFGWVGGALGSTGNGQKIALQWDWDNNVQVNGDMTVTGDILLTNADCAEDFDIVGIESVEPGTVMVFDEDGALQPSEKPYDKRVAGVISGAGDFRPGITLDKQDNKRDRLPLALTGKAYCKVDADHEPVEVGDLLTTSSTIGHAMKADDPARSFGAVIGKAVRPLKAGRGLVPMLVALQ